MWGTVTTSTYLAKTARVLSVQVDPASDSPHTQAFTYDPDGKVETVSYDGEVVATPSYRVDPLSAADGVLHSVAYGNGSSLASVSRDANTGSQLGMTWAFPSADLSHPAAVVFDCSGFEADEDDPVAGWTPPSSRRLTIPSQISGTPCEPQCARRRMVRSP